MEAEINPVPEAAERFLRRLRSEPGYGTEHQRWRDVSNVLWFYGSGGPQAVPASGFKDLLITAMDRADVQNLARFALGFPDVALAMWTCKNVPGGTQALADALAEAEQIDTPAARKILGTRFETSEGPVMVSAPGAVHTPHHGPTDRVCHPENGERKILVNGHEYVLVDGPSEGELPPGRYTIKYKGPVVPDMEPDSSPIPWRNAYGSL